MSEKRASHQEPIDKVIERHARNTKDLFSSSSIVALKKEFMDVISACDANNMLSRLRTALKSAGGQIQVVFVKSDDELPVFEGRTVWGHAGKYITVFALDEENISIDGRRKILGRLFHEIRARSTRASEIFDDRFEKESVRLQEQIEKEGFITDLILREEFTGLIFAAHPDIANRDYATYGQAVEDDSLTPQKINAFRKALIQSYQAAYSRSYNPYSNEQCLAALLAKIKNGRQLSVCREFILAYQDKIGESYAYVTKCLPALLTNISDVDELRACNNEIMLLTRSYRDKFRGPDIYISKHIPSLLANIKNSGQLAVCREFILAYQDKFGDPDVYIEKYLQALLKNTGSVNELRACNNEIMLSIKSERNRFGDSDDYVRAYLPAILAKVSSAGEIRAWNNEVARFVETFRKKKKFLYFFEINPRDLETRDSYLRRFLSALITNVSSADELRACSNELTLLVQSCGNKFIKSGVHMEGWVPALLAKIRNSGQLAVCREFILAYQDRFGSSYSYAENCLPALLTNIRDVDELRACNNEIMLLAQSYNNKLGDREFYISGHLSYLLTKIQNSGQLAVCRELILEYQDRFGAPDRYTERFLPTLLQNISGADELRACHNELMLLLQAYESKSGRPGANLLGSMLPSLFYVKNSGQLAFRGKLILAYQDEIEDIYLYASYCLPALLTNISDEDELRACNNELIKLAQYYRNKYSDSHDLARYIENHISTLLTQVKNSRQLAACGKLILAYQDKIGRPNEYIQKRLPALLTAINSGQSDFLIELINAAVDSSQQGETALPADMDALITELTKAGSANEPGRAIGENKLLRKHKTRFYRIAQADSRDLERGEFAKSGPFLATRKDGVVVPAVGDFYIVNHASQEGGRISLDIRRLSDAEVEERYGLVSLRRPDGQPYEMEFSSLRDVVGRLSMLPGSFGWAQILSDHRGEEPLRQPQDLFIPIVTGEKLSFQPARLEIKGIGTPVIKSLHNVFDASGKPIQIMENQTSPPDPGISFRLLDEKGRVITTDINVFLRSPGLLSGTNYQPYFNSPPGLEEADQSQRANDNERRVSENGVTLPNSALFHWWFSDKSAGAKRSYGITVRLAKSGTRALRVHELLYEYEQFGRDSYLGRWKAEGKIPAMLKEFLYRVGLNITAMNRSGLYLFPNGDRRVDESVIDSYGAIVRNIYGRAVGSLMKAEPAYNMVLNNYCFNGDMADLGEYVDGPGTPDFAVAYLMHFMARLIRDFEAKGLLTSQEAKDPRLLAAYLSGVSCLAPDDPKYAGLKLSFPKPEIFQLDQERFIETSDDSYSGPEMANYKIKIDDPELSSILANVKTSDHPPRNISSFWVGEEIKIFQQGHALFKIWDEDVLKVLGYPAAGGILTQKALRVFLDDSYKHNERLSRSPNALELKELFLGLETAFMQHAQVVQYTGKTIDIEQAVERFNYLVEALHNGEALASFEEEWNSAKLDVNEFMAWLSSELGLETLDRAQPVFVFSEAVAFDNKLAKFLPKLAEKDIKVAVIASTKGQKDLINKLNEGSEKKIIQADSIYALGQAAAKAGIRAPRFYYFRIKDRNEPAPEGPFTIFELTPDMVKKIIDAIGSACKVEPERLPILHETARRFVEAA